MNVPSAAAPIANSSPSLTLFLDALARGNPFNDQRVSATGVQAVDVTSIHDREFQLLTSLARRACTQNEAVGAVVWGESGSGKSNLLRRLHDWAVRSGEAIVLNFLELQASPERLHRSALNALVSLLTKGLSPPWHQTQLYRLLQGLIRPAVPVGNKAIPVKELERVFRSRIADAAASAGSSAATRAAATLLEKFLIASLAEKAKRPEAQVAAAAAAVRRLSGDALDDDEARLVGLRPAEVASPFDASDSVRVLALLAQVARCDGKPLVLCFDQIHTLSRQQVTDIAGLLHTLNDHVRNVLLVLSEVQDQLQRVKATDSITQATWDRITANQIDMPRLPADQGRQILEARLRDFLAPFRELSDVDKRIDADALFPLGKDWFQQRSADLVDVRPRHLLRIARTRWEELQSSLAKSEKPHEWLTHWPPPSVISPPVSPLAPIPTQPLEPLIDAVVEKAYATKLARHMAAPHLLPANADNLCGLTATLLAVGGVGLVVSRTDDDSFHDLLVRISGAGGESTVGIAFVSTGSATSVTGKLRGLATDSKSLTRLLLVTDRRVPLAFGKAANAKGRVHYDSLKAKSHFEHIELRFEDYAALESLEHIARLASDLEIDMPDGTSRPLKCAEVIDSYRRSKRFESHALLGRFFGTVKPPDPTIPIREELVRDFIAGRLAITVGADTQELAREFLGGLAAEQRVNLDMAACRLRIESVLRTMAAAKEVTMTPLGESFFILPLRRTPAR